MTLSIASTFLKFRDPDASLAFYRDVLGFEVRMDVGEGPMRWITLGAPGQPGVALVLEPAVVDPSVTEAEAAAIHSLMEKGAFAMLQLASDDVDADFQAAKDAGADVVQEPTDQFYGMRDAALRDPAGNLIRIQQPLEAA